MPPKFTLSPEQQAAAEAKRAARVAKKAATPVPAFTYPEQPFLKRDVHWFGSQGSPQSTSICTWNILAQALIRRTLFPGSDCLRWSQRSSQFSQLLHYDPSLVALQEVDRLDDHTKFLQHGGWQWIYEKGYKAKQHGLLLAWKESQFEKVKSDWVKLDELSIDGTSRTGLSRKTRNIGLCAALRKKSASSDDEQGVILATHHLFWHPCWVYERARQLGLWIQHLSRFRASLPPSQQHWPVVLAGDFNIQPTELGYWLMCAPHRTPPHPMLDAWSRSAVIHKSLDESAATDADQEVDEGEEEEEQQQGDNNAQGQDDPDRILHNCREARPEDGLLSVEELQSLYTSLRPEGGVSLYDASAIPGEEENTFGTRWQEQAGWERPSVDAPGVAEPCYTNVTPLWRCTLDYIVVYPTEKQHQSEVKPTGLLKMPRLQELEWVGLSVERNPS